MICYFCQGRIQKGRKAAGKRMRIGKANDGRALFIHTKCFDGYRVKERIRQSQNPIYEWLSQAGYLL